MADRPAGVLLLAAGRSRRFGQDKRQVTLASGSTLLDTTLANIEASGLPMIVCLDPTDSALADALMERGREVLMCHNASRGMGSTLAEGVSHLPGWDSVLVALADMAWIAPATYNLVADNTDANAICTPYYKSQRGHPVGFGRNFYSRLTQLDGEQGAQALLRQSANSIKHLVVSDPGILLDADTPADLALTDNP